MSAKCHNLLENARDHARSFRNGYRDSRDYNQTSLTKRTCYSADEEVDSASRCEWEGVFLDEDEMTFMWLPSSSLLRLPILQGLTALILMSPVDLRICRMCANAPQRIWTFPGQVHSEKQLDLTMKESAYPNPKAQ